MTKYLSLDDLRSLAQIVKKSVAQKGADFYGWRNPPATDLARPEADKIWEEKLNGAYGERFVLSVCTAISAARMGARIALLQIQKEEGLPFDAKGWLVMSVNGHPAFHLAPWDLPMSEVSDAGLVTVVAEGSAEALEHGWKGTNKVQELGMLLDIV